MADNWSGSVFTLTDPGDWAKWTITLTSTDATNLNNLSNTTVNFFAVRHAMSAADRQGDCILVVNDVMALSLGGDIAPFILDSSSAWDSDERFWGGFADASGSHAAIDFSPGTGLAHVHAIIGATPWVTGSNTIRVFWAGDAGASEQVEIDFLAVQAGSGASVTDDWGNLGRDDIPTGQDIKPPGSTGFDAHSDPNPLGTGSKAHTWILQGAGASTGTAADSIIEIVKFCPPTATIRVTGAGDPVAGSAGIYDETIDTPTVTTLDGNGEATFTITVGHDATFWYGGNDDWAPAAGHVDDNVRIGCGGWHVGYIAIGA